MLRKTLKCAKSLLFLPRQVAKIQESLGRIETEQIVALNDLSKSEFRVFSQWGEDVLFNF